MTRPIGGCDDERARARVRPSTDSRPTDRSFASIESSSSTVRIVPTEDSFIRSRDRSVGRSVDGWNGWNGWAPHPSLDVYIQTDDTYIHDNRPIIIYYIERARPTDPRAPPPPTPPRARSTSHDDDDDDDFFRRSSVVDATTDSRDDRGTNERAPRVSVGDDDDEGRRRRR